MKIIIDDFSNEHYFTYIHYDCEMGIRRKLMTYFNNENEDIINSFYRKGAGTFNGYYIDAYYSLIAEKKYYL